MQLISLPCGPLAVNTYIVSDGVGGPCAVIDPGDARVVLDCLRHEGNTCEQILLTHGHFDHIWGVSELIAATGASVAIHENDADKLQSSRKSLAVLIGRALPAAKASRLLRDGDTVSCGELLFSVIHTPGHSEGGVCYVLQQERVIFCGDTLFQDSVGRTDFPGANPATLVRSVRERLFPLLGDYTLYPGHGPATTLAHERRCNPFVNAGEDGQ